MPGAYVFISWATAERQGLRYRAYVYRSLVQEGTCDSLHDAVRFMHVRWRRDREASKKVNGDLWRKIQARKYQRRLRFLTEMVHAAGQPCVYCGDPNPRTVDHFDPSLPRGGPDEIDNLVPCCRTCNSHKGARTPEEWRDARRAAGLPWPPKPSPRRPKIPAHLSYYRLTPVQTEMLETIALQRGAGVPLGRTFQDISIKVALRHRLIEPTADASPTRYALTDRGHVALETGRLPR